MRYFLVFYGGYGGRGWLDFTTKDNHYLNLPSAKQTICKKYNYNLSDICITNVIELSEDDYQDATEELS